MALTSSPTSSTSALVDCSDIPVVYRHSQHTACCIGQETCFAPLYLAPAMDSKPVRMHTLCQEAKLL